MSRLYAADIYIYIHTYIGAANSCLHTEKNPEAQLLQTGMDVASPKAEAPPVPPKVEIPNEETDGTPFVYYFFKETLLLKVCNYCLKQ